MAGWTTSPAGTTAGHTSCSLTAMSHFCAVSPATTPMAVSHPTALPSKRWEHGPVAKRYTGSITSRWRRRCAARAHAARAHHETIVARDDLGNGRLWLSPAVADAERGQAGGVLGRDHEQPRRQAAQ